MLRNASRKDQPPRAKGNMNTASILVNPGSRSYVDAVRALRSINPTASGVQVKRVSKTSSGEVRLLVRQTSPGASTKFAEEIKFHSSFTVTTRNNTHNKALIIRDLDASIEPKDLLEELVKDGTPAASIILGPLKPTRSGSSHAS